MSNSKTNVTVHVEGGQGELEIIDGTFSTVGRGFGTLKTELNPGIYKARVRLGDAQYDELFSVEQNANNVEIEIKQSEALEFTSPVPLKGTSTSHEYQQGPLHLATANNPVDAGLGQGASFLLFIRDPSKDNLIQLNTASPVIRENYHRAFCGYRLLDADGIQLLNLDNASSFNLDSGCAISNVELKPGFYVLSYEPENGKKIAMPLMMAQTWQTQVCILVNFPKGLSAPGEPNLPDRAIMLTPSGVQFDPSDDRIRLTEIARYAFEDRRSIVTNELVNELPLRKPDNPILELLYAHQLLMDKQPDLGFLKTLLDRLSQMLGTDSPDVRALKLVLDHLNGIKPEPISAPLFPPMLRASWRILAHYPVLFPPGSLLCEAATHLVSRGVWFAWRPIASWSAQALTDLFNVVAAFPSGNAMLDIARQQPLDAIVEHLKTEARTRGMQDDVSLAHDAMIALAKTIPWGAMFKRFNMALAEHDRMADFTNLQKSLLPTLQLIHELIKEDGDFSGEEFKQLLEGIHVPLPVLYESLLDLAKKVKGKQREVANSLHLDEGQLDAHS